MSMMKRRNMFPFFNYNVKYSDVLFFKNTIKICFILKYIIIFKLTGNNTIAGTYHINNEISKRSFCKD